MSRALIEAYVTALLESDEALQLEFASLAGGAIQGVIAQPYVAPSRLGNKKNKKRKKKQA